MKYLLKVTTQHFYIPRYQKSNCSQIILSAGSGVLKTFPLISTVKETNS